MRTTTLCFGALALGMSVIGATSAQAARPEVVEKFEDRFTVEDEFLTNVCGFTVMADGVIKGTFRSLGDGRIHLNERGKVVLSNPDNGRTLTNTWRQNVKSRSVETFSEDGGTLTIEFDDTIIGMPDRWLDENGKTLIKDTGFARFIGEVVIDLGDLEDPSDDVVQRFSEDITTHGPHPILDGGGLDPSLACEFLA